MAGRMDANQRFRTELQHTFVRELIRHVGAMIRVNPSLLPV